MGTPHKDHDDCVECGCPITRHSMQPRSYCSRKCANRATQRAYRGEHEDERLQIMRQLRSAKDCVEFRAMLVRIGHEILRVDEIETRLSRW